MLRVLHVVRVLRGLHAKLVLCDGGVAEGAGIGEGRGMFHIQPEPLASQ
jgi:hypothetical protein